MSKERGKEIEKLSCEFSLRSSYHTIAFKMSPHIFATILLLHACMTSSFAQDASPTIEASPSVEATTDVTATTAIEATTAVTVEPNETNTAATPAATTTAKKMMTSAINTVGTVTPTSSSNIPMTSSSSMMPEVCKNSTVNCKTECCAEDGLTTLHNKNITILMNCTMGAKIRTMNITKHCNDVCDGKKDCSAGINLQQSPWLLLLTFVAVFSWMTSSSQ